VRKRKEEEEAFYRLESAVSSALKLMFYVSTAEGKESKQASKQAARQHTHTQRELRAKKHTEMTLRIIFIDYNGDDLKVCPLGGTKRG
jgi:hypothetical protein